MHFVFVLVFVIKYHASPGAVILGRGKDWHWLVLFVLLGANDSGSKANSSPCWSFCFYNWRIFLWESFTEKPLKYNCLGLNIAPEDAYVVNLSIFIFWSQFHLLTNGNWVWLKNFQTILLFANLESSRKLSTVAISLWLFLQDFLVMFVFVWSFFSRTIIFACY